MADRTIKCDNCSANIRFQPEHIGRKVRCPKCKAALTVPDPDIAADDDDPLVAVKDEKPSHLCTGCGKSITGRHSRCKRCREEAERTLATRIKQDSGIEEAYAKAANFSTAPHRGGKFPHWIHLLALLVTGGLWLPFYLRSYLRWRG